MKKALVVTVALLVLSTTPALAHRTDEYLQATTILVSKNRLQAEMRLTPGTAVLKTVLDSIDTNRDGTISNAEQSSYASAVLHDVSFTLDRQQLPLRVAAWRFPTVAELSDGQGEIQIDLESPLPAGAHDRHITFENRHRSGIAAYLVNSLVPQDADIQIVKQNRNYVQSLYEMSYTQNTNGKPSVSVGELMRVLLVGAAILVVIAQAVAAQRKRVTV